MEAILARIDQRLNELGLSANAASKMAGKPDAIRNLRRAVGNKIDVKGQQLGTLAALAPVLKISLTQLLSGEALVPLVGYVGAGAETHRFAEGQGPFDMVPAPDGATENTVAVEVRGTSLGQAFDGWYVFYDQIFDPPTTGLLGRLCVVGLADGRVLVKTLRSGHLPGRHTLESNVGEPPIYDVEILWAAMVRHMTPK